MHELSVSHEPEQPGYITGCEAPQLITAHRLPISSHADIVVARQEGRALAKSMTFSATDSAFIATTVSELALPDVRRLVDEFDVVADGSAGMTLRATKWCRRR
jgi:hypothetical protein